MWSTLPNSIAMEGLQTRGSIINDTDQVLVKARGGARILTLNIPKQLNAITPQMVLKMLKLYSDYEEDSKVKIIILKGEGRAFCSGGDLAAFVHHIRKGTKSYCADFFWNEYILSYIIATYGKPQVSFLNGIVMGGGAAVSIPGRFQVVTEKTLFAMPEILLGLYSDIGSSYFLSRTPGYFGEYLGLTGARLDGPEMLACGLATHFVLSDKLDKLEDSLVEANTSNLLTVGGIINKFSQYMPPRKESAYNRLDVINECFSKGTVEEILSALEQETTKCSDNWIKIAIESLKKATPTGLKITLRAIRECRSLQVGQCFIRDYRLSHNMFSKGLASDFYEGCRALIVDKDKNPKWKPSKLELIDDKMVDMYFSFKLDEELTLPKMGVSAISAMSKL